MIKKNTAKIKQEIADITVTDKKNNKNYIIVGVDLSKSKLDVKHIKSLSWLSPPPSLSEE